MKFFVNLMRKTIFFANLFDFYRVTVSFFESENTTINNYKYFQAKFFGLFCLSLCAWKIKKKLLCYAMFCYVMLCYVMLCYVMLCYVMLCYVMLCYVMLCYVMLMLCYVDVMLCYGI